MSLLDHRIRTGAGLRGAFCVLLFAGGSFAQKVVQSFEGDKGPGLAVCESGVTHCDRPEMNLGVNGKQIVQVTWQHVNVYDYSGKLLRSTSMDTMVRNAGLNPVHIVARDPHPKTPPGAYEPSIVFNEFIDRWIISVTGENDSMLVSATSDALGAWGGIYPSCLENGPCLNFDPAVHIGYDRNGVYFCGGHMGDDNPHTIPKVAYDCFAIPTAEVRAIAQRKPPAHINRAHNMPLDIFPAVDITKTKAPTAPALFLSKTCDRVTPGACQNAMNYPFHWLVTSFTWNGTGGSYAEQELKTDVGSTQDKWQYSKPCCAPLGSVPQAGNDKIVLRVAESHRLTNLVQHGSHLQGVETSGPCTKDCGSQGTDTTNVMFWVDLDCSKPGACVVSQTAKISGPDFNPEFASVGIDAAGNVGIVAVSSTATTNLSILLWTRKASDPPNTFTGPVTVAAGTKPFTCLNTRDMATIGNAVGVQTALDPDGRRLWVTQQWGNDAERCVWTTRIVGYQIADSNNDAKKKR